METVKLKLKIETNDEGDNIETALAVMVRNLNNDKVWLPKSKIEIYNDIIEIPEWLAENKELI